MELQDSFRLIDIFYYMYCLISYSENFPQVFKLLKTKRSNDISLASTTMGIISSTCWLIWIIGTMQFGSLLVAGVVDCLLYYVNGFLVYRYREGSKHNIDSRR